MRLERSVRRMVSIVDFSPARELYRRQFRSVLSIVIMNMKMCYITLKFAGCPATRYWKRFFDLMNEIIFRLPEFGLKQKMHYCTESSDFDSYILWVLKSSFTLKEERRLSIFENRVMRKIFEAASQGLCSL